MQADDIERIFRLAVEKLSSAGAPFSAADREAALRENDANFVLPREAIEDIREDDIEKKQALASLIKEMSIPQKTKLALFGNQTARMILLRDSNRLIPQFVLQNSRITENEILEIARNAHLDEAILRSVAGNSTWMKSYAIKLALVSNPKVSADISLRWLKFIKDKDLRNLSKSKNVPQLIATQARKLLDKRENH